MSTTVLYETADGVATLTLNRPDRLNTMTDELLTAAQHAEGDHRRHQRWMRGCRPVLGRGL